MDRKETTMKRLTPVKAIRAKCVDCSGFELKAVRECPFNGEREELCSLYHLRMGKGSRAVLKSIRHFCLWCCKDQPTEVRLCPAVKCALWEYRFGKRPRIAPFLPEILTTEGVLEAVEAGARVRHRVDTVCTEKGLSR
jgi:hypothetical protein